MDRHELVKKLVEGLKSRKRTLVSIARLAVLGGVCALVVFIGVQLYRGAKYVAHASTGWKVSTLIHAYSNSFKTIQAKVDSIHRAEEENQHLRLENANLRLKVEEFRFGCGVQAAADHSKKTEQKLIHQTGTRIGRTLASIQYQPPTHLLPAQLYTLAVSYFRAAEYEKAAVILTYLTEFQENEAYRNARNYLMAGISWYRLDHFELAENYLSRILENKEGSADGAVLAQASLWRALVAEKLGKHTQSQDWLISLIDKHPRSTEASWVNSSQEVRRAPASKQHHE
jgi:tetratricopeptide (TPR) repeat protein